MGPIMTKSYRENLCAFPTADKAQSISIVRLLDKVASKGKSYSQNFASGISSWQ